MYLLIDAGNSRLKWLFGDRLPGVVETLSYRSDWRRKLHRAWHLLPQPDAVALSNVKDREIETVIAAFAAELWQKPLCSILPPQHTGARLTLAYDDPQTLGSDRYLAMLGARDLSDDPLCVIGCGTALTVDVVDGQGKHLGGSILPGIRLAENALLQNTHRLIPMRWTPTLLGTDTASCIGAGIHHALPGGVAHIIDALESRHGNSFERIAFGGDAQILFGKNSAYRIEPDLVFAGMFVSLTEAAPKR